MADLLRTLESLRPKQPVHGVVVTVSADMLANGRPEDLDGWSRRLRERLDEVSGLLGVDVPVHLLVTRCDMIPGFAEFFADVREAERTQVWGFTLPLGGAATPAIDRITAELQEILRVLSQRSVRRANVRDPLESRLAAFQFPLWFAAFRPNLLQVAATLFVQNRFQDPLLARGVWFTSAAEARGYHTATGAQSGRGYALRDVLATHVAGDANLAVPSAAELRRRLHQRLLLAAPLLCGAALTAALSLTAYQANRALLSEFTTALNAAAGARTPMPVAALDALRARTAELREHVEKGPPRWLRMGMFVGDRVAPRASTAFAVYALRDVVRGALETERRELIDALGATGARTPSAVAAAQGNLRAYQLLTTPRRAGDPDPHAPEASAWLAARLTERWTATHRGASPDDVAQVLACARLYVAALADDPRLGTPRDLQLVARATAALPNP
ncbi:MAG: type VI secretion protein IcmF/TssM N-terminal domain-containing protein [Polyangiales bacterium]